MAKFDQLYPNQYLEDIISEIQSILASADRDGSLDPLLTCFSTLFDCDRIYIFQKNRSGNYDQTYEWCAPGIPHRQHTLQNLHWEVCVPYYNRFQNDQFIEFSDVEDILFADPELYHILKPQGVNSLLAGQLTFRGMDLGFFGVDNIRPDLLPYASDCFRMFRFFIAASLYSHLDDMHELVRNVDDGLVGIGTWHSLYDSLDKMDRGTSIGIIYINLLALHDINVRRGRRFGDSLLIEVGRQIVSTFSIHHVYRIHGDDFVIALSNVSHQWFYRHSDQLRKKLLMTGISLEYGSCWSDSWNGSSYQMVARARSRMTDLAKCMEDPTAPAVPDNAMITLYRGEAFTSHADTLLRMLPEQNRRIAVLAVDYNRFTLYNNIFGRREGNSLLLATSRHLAGAARTYHGIAGYMGGDNFALIIPVIHATKEELYQRISDEIRQQTTRVGFSASCGICLCDHYTNESAALLYDHAMAALSGIRNSFTEHVAFFDPVQFHQIRESHLLILDMDEALRKHEFTFELLPRVDMTDGTLVGAAASLCWDRDGIITPRSEYMQQAEENGFIFALEHHLWNEVCSYQRRLLDRGITPLPLSVPVSSADFYFGDLSEHFRTLLETYHLDPSMIELEIKEQDYMRNQAVTAEFISRVHQLGIRVIISEFGNGYSSLDSIRILKADTLKMTGALAASLQDETQDFSVISSVISMAKLLGRRVIAGGVETERQKQLLLSENCHFAEGSLFYPVCTINHFTELLTDEKKCTE